MRTRPQPEGPRPVPAVVFGPFCTCVEYAYPHAAHGYERANFPAYLRQPGAWARAQAALVAADQHFIRTGRGPAPPVDVAETSEA